MFNKYVIGLMLAAGVFGVANATELKIGYVNTQRLFRDAPLAVKAQKRLDTEFGKRDQELQKQLKQIQGLQESLQKNEVTMAESDRRQKEKELADQTRDYQRKLREFREDLNSRQNEEMAQVLERANKVIRNIAEAEKIDLIIQDAAYVSPRIDITDRVIKALAEPAGK